MKTFLNNFTPTSVEDVNSWDEIKSMHNNDEFNKFITSYAGTTFNNGVYRIHNSISGPAAQANMEAMFPEYKNKFLLFGFSWLGKQYARSTTNPSWIYLFDILENEVYSAEGTINFFHDTIVCEADILEEQTFKEWLVLHNRTSIGFSQCVEYEHPLFLGGKDEISNQSLTDMDVYLSITSQLL